MRKFSSRSLSAQHAAHARFIAASIFIFSSPLCAAVTWTGGGSSSIWSIANNWGGILPAPDDSLSFAGSNKTTNTNDFPAFSLFHNISFASGAAAFNLQGNAIDLAGNVTNSSSNLQTIQLPLVLQQSLLFNATSQSLAISGAISAQSGTPTLTLTGASSRTGTLSGVISDGSATSLALNMNGANTWTLTAANTYSGGTTINSGVLRLGDGTLTGSISGNVALNAGTLTFAPASDLTFNGNITGAGAVWIEPGGSTNSRILLAGNNSFGDLTLKPSTYLLASDTATGGPTGSLMINFASDSSQRVILETVGGPRTISKPITFINSGGLPGLVLQGAYDLTLDGGIVNKATFGYVQNRLTAGAHLTINGTIYISITNAGNRSMDLRNIADDGSHLTIINANIATSLDGSISDANLFGTDTLIFNSTSLAYSGGSGFNAGTSVYNVAGVLPETTMHGTATAHAYISLTFGGSVAYAGGMTDPVLLSRLAGAMVVANGADSFATGSLDILNAADAATNLDFSLAPSTGASWGSMGLGAALNAFTYSGTLTPRGQEWRLGGGNGTLTFTQPLTDRNSAPANLNVLGGASGVLILTSTLNTYTGATIFSGKNTILKNGASDTLPATTTVNFAAVSTSSSIYDLNGFNQTFTGLSGVGTVLSSAGASTLTLSNNGTASAFTGSMTGNLHLVKNSTATLSLAGITTYSGNTLINAGTLLLNATSQSLHAIAGAGTLRLAANRSLTADALTVSTVILDASSQLAIRPGGSNTSKLSSLTLATGTAANTWTARLDLNDNALIVQSNPASKSSTLAQLAQQIKFAATSAGAGGLTSSTAAADPTHLALGLFDNAVLGNVNFAGGTNNVDANSILILQSLLGDANNSHGVDGDDLRILANNWHTFASDWSHGDLNADGFVDNLDVGIILSHWDVNTPFSPRVDYTSGFTYALVAVPESSSLALLGLSLPLLIRKRRFRSGYNQVRGKQLFFN